MSITEEAKGLKDLGRADVIYFVSKFLSGGAELGVNRGRGGLLLSASTNLQGKLFNPEKLLTKVQNRRKESSLKVPAGVGLTCRTSMMLR